MTDYSTRITPSFQRRTSTLNEWELRDDDDSGGWSFEGVACTVDYAYEVRDWLGTYTETINTGAFKRTLNDPAAKVSLHVNHQHGRAVPLATRHAGTLELFADPNLRVRAKLDPERPDVQILRSALKRGEISDMSIGFNDVKDGSVWSEDYTERSVNDLRLRECSVVEDGANELTMASIRSLVQEFTGEIDETEVRQAIAYLESFLPLDPPPANEVGEVLERTGLVVTDEFIRLYELKYAT